MVVVGAGPAGSATATRLAQAGARVVMIDRARFPRDKPCGGGVTARGLGLIPADITPVVERQVRRVELHMGYGGPALSIDHHETMVHMTQRRRLDTLLAENAARVGVDVREGVRLRQVRHLPDGVEITHDHGQLRAAVMVGADGANGASRAALGVPDPAFAVALEGNLPRGTVGFDDGDYLDRALLAFTTVPGGYTWIFPKGDHVNFGVGGYPSEGPHLRRHLARLCQEFGVDPQALEGVRGHRLPIRRPGSPVAVGRALLVGDAAGLVDPFSGDGMYEAFMSAAIAGTVVGDLLEGRARDLSAYPQALGEALGAHRAGAWLGKLFTERAPAVTTAILRVPRVRQGIAARMCQGTTPPGPGASRVAVHLGRAARRALGPAAA